MKKKVMLISLGLFAAIICLLMVFVVPNFLDSDSVSVSGIQTIDGERYCYDEKGNLVTGWQTLSGYRYFFKDGTGQAMRGWYTDTDEKIYYFGIEGYALTGTQTIDETKHIFDKDGALNIDAQKEFVWQYKNGNYYCSDLAGNLLTGKQTLNGLVYYFSEEGICHTGWITLDGNRYYFSPTERYAPKGWFKLQGANYYFCEEGYALTGKQVIAGTTYTFDKDGRLISLPVRRVGTAASSTSTQPNATPPASSVPSFTWKEENGKTYCMDSAGTPLKGLIMVDNALYFFDNQTGERKSGLLEIAEKAYLFNAETGKAEKGWQSNPSNAAEMYYFADSGPALTDLQSIAEKKYYFNAKGVSQTAWQVVGEHLLYFDTGTRAARTGLQTITEPLPKEIANTTRRTAPAASSSVYYFGTDGYALTGVHKINEKFYYFNTTNFSRTEGWHQVGGKSYAFIGADSEAVSGWRQDAKDDFYYFSPASCEAQVGMLELSEGRYYLGVNGIRQTGWLTINEKMYCFNGENGEALINTWEIYKESNYYLGSDGSAVVDLQTIGGNLYLFSLSGTRLSGWQAYLGSQYYFDEESGAAAKSIWMSKDGSNYYMGGDGKAVKGLYVVPNDGTFYFDVQSGICQTGLKYIDNQGYYFDPESEGHAGRATLGWKTVGVDKYYFAAGGKAATGLVSLVDGVYLFTNLGAQQLGWQGNSGNLYYFNPSEAGNGRAQIGWWEDGNDKYYFDASGKACTSQYTENDITYKFNKSGALVEVSYEKHQWYTDQDGGMFYAGEEGKRVVGLAFIKDSFYFFNNSGIRQSGWVTIDSSGKVYFFADDGKAVSGFYTDKNAKKTYYFDRGNCQMLTGMQFLGDGIRYFFAEDGVMLASAWNESAGEKYYFDADGKAVLGWFSDNTGGSIYYFGKNGSALKGLQEIASAYYYFDEDGKLYSGAITLDNLYYSFTGDGNRALIGLQTIGNDKYYFSEQGFACNGLLKIDGAYYYFSNNVMQTGWHNLAGTLHYFTETGKANVGWLQLDNQEYYTLEDGSISIGIIMIDDYECTFDPDGRLISKVLPSANTWGTEGGKTYYLNEKGIRVTGLCTIQDNLYYFDEDGVMQTGWQKVNDKKYYFAEDGKAKLAWFTDDAKTYYFCELGFALTGGQKINEISYVFDDEGVLQQNEVPSNKDGWVELSNKHFYYDTDGKCLTGLQKIESEWYLFAADGIRLSGKQTLNDNLYYFTGEKDAALRGWHQMDGRWYLFGKDTAIQSLGWQYKQIDENQVHAFFYSADGNMPLGWKDLNNLHRYFFEDGHMAQGWQTIADSQFYFLSNGAMATGEVSIDGVSHFFDDEGRLVTGWSIDSNGNRFYHTVDGPHKGWQQVDSVWYNFDSETGIQQKEWQYRRISDTETHSYFYDVDGNSPSEWHVSDNLKRYFYADGHMALGWQKVDGQDYYFTANGAMATGSVQIGDTLYLFDENGLLSSGWSVANDGTRYYFTEKGLLTGWQKIDERWYLFEGETGAQRLGWQTRTADDGLQHRYYYFSNGLLAPNGWTTGIDATSRYVLADGSMAQGWMAVEEGYRYYFAADGAPLRGWQKIDERWYCLDEGTGSQKTGWQTRVVEGTDVLFFYQADGSLPNAGWVENVDGKTRYIMPEGQLAYGWRYVGAYTYYFEQGGTFLTGTQTIADKQYTFDASGRYVVPPSITSVNFTTGWGNPKTVTVTAVSSPLLANTLQYSFDFGANWQSSSSASFTAGTVLAVGRIRVKDSLGNITEYGSEIRLESTGSTVHGIDVSMHQGVIDWAQVKASGKVDFAIIRSLCWDAAKKGFGIDPYFWSNMKNAKANGIKVGTYLYSYAFNKAEMLQEISYFYNSSEIRAMIKEGIWFDMPVYIDYEDPRIPQYTPHMTISQRTDVVRYGMVLIEQMSAKLGLKTTPGFYTYYSFGKNVINAAALQAENYDFWLAHYGVSAHGWSSQPPIWQYSSTARIPGINTNVDVNHCYKDYNFISGSGGSSGGTPTPTPTPPAQSHTLVVTNQQGQKVSGPASSILAQMVEAEVGGFGNAEVYKAQALAAQSWLLYNYSKGYSAPNVALRAPRASVQVAVNEVVNQTIQYNGAQAFTPYYAYSNGTTNDGGYWGNNLAYLSAVSSAHDKEKAAISGRISRGDLKKRIEEVYGAGYTNGWAEKDWIKIISRNAAGYVTAVEVCGRKPTVDYFYQTIIRYDNGAGGTVYPIASPSFSIDFNGSNMWTFASTGYGHGVGMSQYGAYRLAQQGYTYKQIISHYFPGTNLANVS